MPDGTKKPIDYNEIDSFEFPKPIKLEKRLKDILEDEVDEKYYLSEEQMARLKATTFQSEKEEYRVQDPDSTSRTILARDYKDPKCVRLGGLYDKLGRKHQAGSIYATGGVCATLSTMQGGNLEPLVVASRGRGNPPKQHLEPRKEGLTNTITSVEKDNYVLCADSDKNSE